MVEKRCEGVKRMNEKTIQENESSKTIIQFDGEIVVITQTVKGILQNSVHLYFDEFEDGYEFLKRHIDYTE